MPDLSTLLSLPYLDRSNMSEANWAEFRRLKAAGHVVYVRQLGDGEYEMVDGGRA